MLSGIRVQLNEMEKYSLWKENLSEADATVFLSACRKRDNGDLDTAQSILIELLDKDENSTLFNVTLGDIYKTKFEASGNRDHILKAEKHFKKSASLSPKSGLVSCLYFHCLWDLDKQKEAVKEMHRFTAVGNPEDYSEIIEDYGKDISKIEAQLENKT